MDFEKLTPELLDSDQKELAEIIGWEAYQKLLVNYAGCRIYIKKPERNGKQNRDEIICQKFDGGNYKELAKEFRLSESAVRKILRNCSKK
ncbi:MAG: DNA-binding protein [Oscillospiraceae bacterium]|nr:DNA-binding protein [Oscillospiraceae bacterium]